MPEQKPELLKRIKIEGFKSIAACDLELGPLNVLIGANGAGKSNFLSFLSLMRAMAKHNLQLYTARQGGPDSLLRFGRKRTPQIRAELGFELQAGAFEYHFALEPTPKNEFIIQSESLSTTLGTINFQGSFGKESSFLDPQQKIDAIISFSADLDLEESNHDKQSRT